MIYAQNVSFKSQQRMKSFSKNTTTSNNFEFEAGRVREILLDLGYGPLQDCGQFFRTKAVYRGGDNPTSLQVYKNNGYCIDYAANEKFSFGQLLKHHISDSKKIKEILNGKNIQAPVKIKKQLEMPRIYEKDCLTRLAPNYFFYTRKNISPATMKKYQAGFAMSGQMYNRTVFPIFDESEDLIGFSGRATNWTEESTFAKWKHIGKKQGWIYPFYLPNLPECREKIDLLGEITVVESIGDSLALTEHGCENHLVNFGLGCSAEMLAFLLEKNPKKIIISTNNDSTKEDTKDGNRGKIAAIKTMAKLSSVFSLDRLAIRLPILNDVSEMHESGIDVLKWNRSGEFLPPKEIYEYAQKNKPHFSKDGLEKFLKKL